LRVLLVKLSSLGDVIHTLPVVQDLHRAYPGIEIDWVVEPAFAGVLHMHPGLRRIIPCAFRDWRRARFNAKARTQMREFWSQLRQESYDSVIDLQGLSKSALVARLAKVSPQGVRFAMANRTWGSSYEPLTRWLADQSIALNPNLHALQRARWLCAKALHYDLAQDMDCGLVVPPAAQALDARLSSSALGETVPKVVFLMGTSRADKTWAETHWIELGQRFNASGVEVCLVHGSEHERQACEHIAAALELAVIWPRSTLVELAQGMVQTQGSVGVDSGLSHLSVALGLVHVQIYRFDTAWRTGPLGCAYQQSVFQAHEGADLKGLTVNVEPMPLEPDVPGIQASRVDEVWRTWLACLAAKAWVGADSSLGEAAQALKED